METLFKIDNLNISSVVKNQRLSFISTLNQNAATLMKEGKNVIKLSGGDPGHFPEKLLTVIQDIGQNIEKNMFNYSPIAGFDKLRELIASLINIRYQYSFKKENILISSGGCSGLFLTLKTLINSGDRVLIQEPCWEYLPRLIENCQGVPVSMKFFLDPFSEYDWGNLISEIKNHLENGIRIIVINSPLNPSGKIIPSSIKNEIIRICHGYGAWFLADDVTIDFNYIEDTQALKTHNFNNFISINSMSKNLGITGLRFGYVVGCENFIKQLEKSQLYTFMYPNSLIQKIMERYLSLGEQEYYSFIDQIVSLYRSRAKEYSLMMSSLNELDVKQPEGGLFIFPKLKVGNDVDFNILLSNYYLAVAPGIAFSPGCKDHFRMFMGVNSTDMQIAVARMKKFFSS